MTDKFDVAQFTMALPKKKDEATGVLRPMFEYLGIVDNEHCWVCPIGTGKLRILVKSSIDGLTGTTDAIGENSIRLILQRKCRNYWLSIGKGPDAFTKRTIGWEKRLLEKIKHVYQIWSKVNQDFTDDEKIFLSKQPHTKGRVFATNPDTGGFRWLS